MHGAPQALVGIQLSGPPMHASTTAPARLRPLTMASIWRGAGRRRARRLSQLDKLKWPGASLGRARHACLPAGLPGCAKGSALVAPTRPHAWAVVQLTLQSSRSVDCLIYTCILYVSQAGSAGEPARGPHGHNGSALRSWRQVRTCMHPAQQAASHGGALHLRAVCVHRWHCCHHWR